MKGKNLYSVLIVVSLFIISIDFSSSGSMDVEINPEWMIDDTLSHGVSDLNGCVFTENMGQIENREIMFYCDSIFSGVGFTKDGIMINAPAGSFHESVDRIPFLPDRGFDRRGSDLVIAPDPGINHIKLTFENPNDVIPKGRNPAPWRSNYFLGNDPSEWKTSVPNYRQIVYEDLWDGIDLVLKPQNGALKYDFILEPYADHSRINVKVEGCTDIVMRDGGDLGMIIGDDRNFDLVDGGLDVFYSEDPGEKLEARFILDDDSFSFDLENRDMTRSVVIDPLIYSTYIGGSGWDTVWDSDIDGSGNLYITQFTDSVDFPTTAGSYDPSYNSGYWDVYVAKLNPTASSLVYATYLGGIDADNGFSISVDDSGCAYVTGSTNSINFPTTSASFEPDYNNGGFNAFVTKLSPSGDSLIYSTYLGGGEDDFGNRICTDQEGCAYVTGSTNSTDFPTTSSSFDRSYNGGDTDAFITKLNPTGETLEYSTFLGGKRSDSCIGIYIDSAGDAFVIGETTSYDFPTTSTAFDTEYNESGVDVFVSKIGASGSSLVFSTYLGGDGIDLGNAIVADDDGYSYVVGGTSSGDFPVTDGVFGTSFTGGDMDAYVAKINISGDSLVYSTYLGGTESEIGYGIDIDEYGYSFVTGMTSSMNFPVKPLISVVDRSFNGGAYDAFITKIDRQGSQIIYSTYLGGGNEDSGFDIVSETTRYVYAVGSTNSRDFPVTPRAISLDYNGGKIDIYAVKIDLAIRPSQTRALTAVSDDRTVSLSWKPPAESGGSPILGYKLYRGLDEDKTLIASLNDTSYIDTDLTNGMHYFYQVSAENSIGEGEWSNEVIVTPATVPSAPVNVTVHAGDRTVNLSWGMPPDNGGQPVKNYNVYKGTSSGSLTKIAIINRGRSYVDTNLRNGVPCFYQVSASNSIGEGLISVEVTATPGIVPEVPENFIAESSDGRVSLSWDAPRVSGGFKVTGYNIYRGLDPEKMKLLTFVEDRLNYADEYVVNGNTYSYMISANNSLGEGNLSGIISATPGDVPDIPGNFMAKGGDGQIELSWKEPFDDGGFPVIAYKLYRRYVWKSYELLATVSDVFSYTDEGLANGIVYYYRIKAYNSLGECDLSDEISAMPTTYPDTPRYLEIVQVNYTVEISWAEPEFDGGSPVIGYNAYRGTHPESLELFARLPAVLNFTDTNVTPENRYYYKVSAVNENGESSQTDYSAISIRYLFGEDKWGDFKLPDYWWILAIIMVVVNVLIIIAGLLYVRSRKDSDRKWLLIDLFQSESREKEDESPDPEISSDME